MKRAVVVIAVLLAAGAAYLGFRRDSPPAAPQLTTAASPEVAERIWSPPVVIRADGGVAEATISGRVVRGANPVASAAIHFGAHQTTSDDRGAFELRIPSAEAPTYIFAATQDAHSSAAWIDPRFPPKGEVLLALKPARAVRGVVVDRATLRPLAGALVELRQSGAAFTTGPDGAFVFDRAPFGMLDLRAKAKGYVPSGAVFTLRPDEDTTLRLELEPGGVVSGRVVDSRGQALPGVKVRGKRMPSDQVDAETTTDDTGAFALEGVANRAFNVQAQLGGYAQTTVPVQAPAKDVRIVLELGAQIEGVVRDTKGNPVAGVEVRAKPEFPGAITRESASTRTGEDGTFELEGLGVGPYAVRFFRYEHLDRPAPVRLELSAGERRQLELTLPSTESTLSGTVRDARSKAPVENARLSLSCEDESHAEADTDSAGRFSFSGLPELSDVCKLTVEHRTHQTLETTLAGLPRDAELFLQRACVVIGRVVDELGQPITEFYLNGAQQFAADGRFEAVANPGKRTLRLSAEGYEEVRREVEVATGDVFDAGDVVLRQGADVVVRVLDRRGRPVAGASIYSIGSSKVSALEQIKDGSAARIAFTALDGATRLTAPDGKYCFVAGKHPYSPSSMASCPHVFNGPVGRALTLVLAEPAWVEGTVRRDGGPIRGAMVVSKADELHAVTGDDGRYRLGPLAEGEHQLGVIFEAGAPGNMAIRNVAVKEGETAQLDFSDRSGPEVDLEVRSRSARRVFVVLVKGHFTKEDQPKEVPEAAAQMLELSNGAAATKLGAPAAGPLTLVVGRVEGGKSSGPEHFVRLTLSETATERVVIDLDDLQ